MVESSSSDSDDDEIALSERRTTLFLCEDQPTSETEDMSEQLPNERSENVTSSTTSIPRVLTVSSLPNGILGIFGDQQLQEALKATHIVIQQDQSVVKAGASSNIAPLTPPVTTLSPLILPAQVTTNPKAASAPPTGRKYTWDASVLSPVLSIRCRNIRGDLHKSKFGSGSRGKCILLGEDWYTPSEFEIVCGRGNSKDWKRSIRYGGRTLQCLIEEGFLQPHASSCTCSICCNEQDTVAESSSSENASGTGPVRLFTPYKRRKRQEKQKFNQDEASPAGTSENSNAEQIVVPLATTDILKTTDIQVVTSIPTANVVEATSVPTLTHNAGNACPESVIVTPAATPQTPRNAPTALDFAEQRQWWQLEEMVKNVVRQAQELQKQVETAKAQSTAAREAAVQQLRVQMENEKKEALNACRVEAQMTLSRAILEAKTEKELAIEQALQQARLEMQDKLDAMVANKTGIANKRCANCNREAFSECTGCHRVSYCSTFCQRKDWENHQEECGDSDNLTPNCIEELT